MEKGLARALEIGPVASIGVDTWGVDYGLLDGGGELVAPPFSYRDHRTDGYRAVVDRIGESDRCTRRRACSSSRSTRSSRWRRTIATNSTGLGISLLLPELLVHHLTGAILGERTSAGTTGLLDLATEEWSDALVDAVGLDRALLPVIQDAGTRAGTLARRSGPPRRRPRHRVGRARHGRDRRGARPAFVSAGTWLLVGREQAAPDLSEAARRANFTNELGALGGVRFLKNLAGSWLIEELPDRVGRSTARRPACAPRPAHPPTARCSTSRIHASCTRTTC